MNPMTLADASTVSPRLAELATKLPMIMTRRPKRKIGYLADFGSRFADTFITALA